MADIRVERNYRTDDGDHYAALIADGTVITTLTMEECFALADELVTAGERFDTTVCDGGEDDSPAGWLCPICGDVIRTAVVADADSVVLHPCMHRIPRERPLTTTVSLDEAEECC